MDLVCNYFKFKKNPEDVFFFIIFFLNYAAFLRCFVC